MVDYFGVMCCTVDKSLSKVNCKSDFKPTTETVGMFGTCKWFKSKEEQDKFIEYAKKELKYHIEE